MFIKGQSREYDEEVFGPLSYFKVPEEACAFV